MLICVGKPVRRRWCYHLGCRLWPEILEGSEHMVWLQTVESTMWRQLRRDPGPPAPLVKRHAASAVNWLWLNDEIQRRGCGGRRVGEGVGGDKGPEAENRPVRVSVGGRAMSCFGFSGSCETQEEIRGIFILNMVLHCFTELHSLVLMWNDPPIKL